MRKKIKVVVMMFLVIIVLFGLSVLGVSWYVISIGKQNLTTIREQPKGDAIIVLGAYVRPDGSVSEMLKDRLDFAVMLYKQESAPKVIVSGDHGQVEYDEVNTMRNYLLEAGVPSEDIFMDHAGFNTYNSLYRAKDVFCVKKPIIVSQEYHVIRANYIGKKLGLEVTGVGADPRKYGGMIKYQIREFGSRYKAFVECLFKPEPRYLGETIPVWGNGEVTLDDKQNK